MKIEKLAEDKIKITITVDDLEARNIDLYSFMYNSPESQDLFWDVMSEAEKEYGFNVDDSMIYVESSTSGGGNFTLIVTKTKEKPLLNYTQKKQHQIKKENVRLKRKKTPVVMTDTIYEFDNFDDICSFCKAVDVQGLKENSLYTLNSKHYLRASEMPYTSILEYATIVKYPRIIQSKIHEYGNVLIESEALQTVAKYFNKKRRTRKKREC